MSGEVLWKHDTGAPVSSSAAVAGERVLIGSRSYDLFAFDAATGAVDWRHYYWFSWVDSDPTVMDGTVYVGSSDALKLIALDLDGVAVSSGSACASGKVGRSTVLAAMGVPAALAAGALRVSLGWNSRPSDVDRFLAVFDRLISSLYKRRERAA